MRELGGDRVPRRRPDDELRMVTDEQAALRRLAMAVARDVPPAEIFTAVADEIGPLLGADEAAVVRFESDRTATVVASRGYCRHQLEADMRVELDDSLAITAVFRTGRSARVDDEDYRTASGAIADFLRRMGTRSAVASPITVEGGLWGAIVASTRCDLLPADTEERMANFAELVATVISSAESRAELTASRARVVAAGDQARRRIQRDLHDGAQQRLVATVVTLQTARVVLGDATGPVVDLVDEALAHAEAGERRAARARPRNPACRAHPRRTARRRRCAGLASPSARVCRRDRRAIPGSSGGDRLLHRRRGTDQRRQARPRHQRADRRRRRRRQPAARGPRRRRRRRHVQRELRAARAPRPRRRR